MSGKDYDDIKRDGASAEKWIAYWIWTKDNTSAHNWACFRKHFCLDSVPDTVRARIAVDSSYWLWINGTLVITDGGLKRGPTPDDTYFERVEIAPYLRAGENTVAVLGWYFGSESDYYSYHSSGQAGFLLEAQIGEYTLKTDGSWKAKTHTGFLNRKATHNESPTYRIPEGHHFYDAGLAEAFEGWESPDFDDSSWGNALTSGQAPCAPWNGLWERSIPQMKYLDRSEYVNNDAYAVYKNTPTKKNTKIRMELPYNMQVQPYLEICAPAGLEIAMLSDGTDPINTYYITKQGEQEFEGYLWMSAQSITYIIPKGVTVRKLAYTQSGYDAEFAGSFSCDDDFYDILWKKSLYTLYITMRDNYMDCPDRERAQWWGDSTNEAHMTHYALDTKARFLYRAGVDRMLAWRKWKAEEYGSDKILQTVVPINEGYFELPFQQLAGVVGMWTYYLYTGERDFLEQVYEPALDYLKLWKKGDDGLVIHRPGNWDWPDWGMHHDKPVMENVWYYYAMSCVLKMSKELEPARGNEFLEERMKEVRDACDRKFWNGRYYYGSTDTRRPDDRANALAVLSGLASKDKYPSILNVLQKRRNSSPYMEKYVLEAMFCMGYAEDALERMKARYSAMVNSKWTTLWEHFRLFVGTHNHAWSGGPLVCLSGSVAGICPIEPGYSIYRAEPQLGTLNKVSAVVPSVRGDIGIDISLDKQNGKSEVKLSSPPGTVCELGVPLVSDDPVALYANGVPIYADGTVSENADGVEFVGLDGRYARLRVKPGEYVFTADQSFRKND
ncbi:MAG: glycoside hydrolase [Clostridia bacterium]|nr:glycoside hydrolase [Clostridia bacterium]